MRPADNPFRTSCLEALDPHGVDVEEVWSALVDQRRGALVGPEGSGKTTLLEALVLHAQRLGWTTRFVRADRDPLPSLSGARTFVALDSLEALPDWKWWLLRVRLQQTTVVAATMHQPGRLPTLREHRTDLLLARQLVERLTDVPVDDALLAESFAKHRGNLRDVFLEFYDLWSTRPSALAHADCMRHATRPSPNLRPTAQTP